MNLRQLEYIVAIADEESISRAAEKLFLSRPALNHCLIKLEEELGQPLFKRVRKKLLPTYTGSVYVEAARQMLETRKQVYKHIADVGDSSNGCLSLGITRGVGGAMLKNVFPKFHHRFPNYKIDLVEGNVRELEAAVERGRIDLAVVGCGSARTTLQHLSFDRCEVVIVLPPGHRLEKTASPKGKRHAALDLRLLADDNFILMNNETNIRAICDYHFAKLHFSPKILMECSLSSLAYSMVLNGIGVSILMEHQVGKEDPVSCFSLRPREIWNHSIAYRKGTRFSRAEESFIELVREYFAENSPF